MMKRAVNILLNPIIKIFSGPVMGFMVGGIAFVAHMQYEMAAVLGLGAVMVTWWLNAAVPMGVTGLLPIIWLPLLGIMSGSAVASTYFGDSVIICWSSFLISEAVEKYNLHKRFAYNVLKFSYRNSAETTTSSSSKREWINSDELLLLSFIFVTGFISMWLSNSAAAALMIPLAKAVMLGLRNDPTSSTVDPVSVNPSQRLHSLACAIDLSIAYAACFGGMSTLTGTGANLVLQGVLQSQFGPNSGGTISYVSWLSIAGPLCLVLLLVLWLVLMLCFTRYEALEWFLTSIALYCCGPKISTKRNSTATSDSISSSPLKSGVRSIIDTTSLFAYSSRQTPKSGYTKQINKEDWDIENTVDAKEAVEMPQLKAPTALRLELSPMASPDAADRDDFLYSGSINFKSSLDAADETDMNRKRGVGSSSSNSEYGTVVRRPQQRTNRTPPRYSMRSSTLRSGTTTTSSSSSSSSSRNSNSSSLLQEVDEYDDDRDIDEGHDGDTSNGGKADEEFTTINFTAQVPSSPSSRDNTGNTNRGNTEGLSHIVSLPPMSYPEMVVMITFIAMALLWVTRDPPGGWGWGLLFPRPQYITDGTVGIACAVFLLCMPATPPTCLSKMSSIHHSILTVLSIYYDGLTPREVNVADSETAMYSGLSNTTDSTHKVEQSSNPMLRNQATKGGSLTIDTSPYRDVKRCDSAENRSSHSPSGIVGVPTRKMSVYCDNGDSIPPLKIDRGQLQKLIDLDSNGERNALSSHYDETDEYINQMTSKSTATATVAHQPESESTLSNAKTVGATNNSEKSKQGNILNFSAVQNLNWNVIFLLGGGFALSKGFEEAGLTQWLAGVVLGSGLNSLTWLIVSASIVACVLTNFIPNIATANILLPALSCMAPKLGSAPIALLAPVTLFSSLALLFPIGTPPNVIVLANNNLSILQLFKVGLLLTAVTVPIIICYCVYLIPLLYDVRSVSSTIQSICNS